MCTLPCLTSADTLSGATSPNHGPASAASEDPELFVHFHATYRFRDLERILSQVFQCALGMIFDLACLAEDFQSQVCQAHRQHKRSEGSPVRIWHRSNRGTMSGDELAINAPVP